MDRRVYLWDNLKVMLMMMVVVTHSVNVYQLQGEYWIQYLWCFIMTYSMPLFTIISGFWYKERTFSYALSRYLYPCILFSVINFIGGGISGAYPNGFPFKSGWAMWYIWSLFVYNIITPKLIKLFGLKKLMVITLLIVFLLGFKFISNNILDAQRVVNFYPFFLLGIIMKDKADAIYNEKIRKRIIWPVLFIILTVVYIVLDYYHYGFCYGTGFMSSHGLSLLGFISRWLNYLLTVGMSISVIMMMPNRLTGITKYGGRTMNVYLLHMVIIFPVCWLFMRPIMHEWYGYCLYIFVVPAFCALLFSKRVDSIMRPILAFSDNIINSKESTQDGFKKIP